MTSSRPCCTSLAAACVAALVLCFAGPPARAAKPEGVSAGELATLPAFCEHTMGFNYAGPGSGRVSPQAEYWVARMGPNFWDMHHYCWGLIKIRRGLRHGVSQMTRTNIIKDVITEYDYVLSRSPGDFLMRPELLLRRGEALMLLDNFPDALASFEEAVKTKPDYWPAYLRIAEFHVKYGKRNEAVAALNRGLEQSPGQPALLDLKKKLETRATPNARKN